MRFPCSELGLMLLAVTVLHKHSELRSQGPSPCSKDNEARKGRLCKLTRRKLLPHLFNKRPCLFPSSLFSAHLVKGKEWSVATATVKGTISCQLPSRKCTSCSQGLLSGHQPVLLHKDWTSKGRNSIVCGRHVIAKKVSACVSQTLRDWLNGSVLHLANWSPTSMHHC